MKIVIGLSPCPNDTFIFDAILNSKIDCEGLEFEPFIADVEELNRAAIDRKLDVTKLSYATFIKVASDYKILNGGSALGFGNGPLLVTKDRDLDSNSTVAIPGVNTTANMLLSVAHPELNSRVEYLFSDIEDAILSGDVDGGVLIHETRFSYMDRGLKLVTDLGANWEAVTSSPIPLGGIAISRNLPQELAEKLDRVMRRSVQFAFDNPLSSREFVKKYAADISDSVIDSHIDMFVNQFTLELGVVGRKAIIDLFERANIKNNDLFV